jgi:hypothetical protein
MRLSLQLPGPLASRVRTRLHLAFAGKPLYDGTVALYLGCCVVQATPVVQITFLSIMT